MFCILLKICLLEAWKKKAETFTYQVILTRNAEAVKVKSLSRVRLFANPWTVAYQAPPSMGFSRQECWSGLPFPSPGDLPDPGIKPGSPALRADALPSEPLGNLIKYRFEHIITISVPLRGFS